MQKFNLHSLLHREYSWSITLPNGSVLSGKDSRNIPILIPKIQRDYAEGRDNAAIESKRLNLLNDMLDVVYGVRPSLSFDFVYGYIIPNKDWANLPINTPVHFVPLDGQQRLTSLFLLHWLFGREAHLRSDAHSLLVYETRDTSEEFCHWLVAQDAKDIINSWMKNVADIKTQNEQNQHKWKTEKDANGRIDPIANRLRFPLTPIPSLFNHLQAIDSFKWHWHNDPNIRSMATVMESAIKLIQERGLSYAKGVANNNRLDLITFMLLDNLDCDGDQLFEKMNARGKALTSFEILKSSLEEEMELQNIATADPAFANNWRTAIDGHWLDYCWDNSAIGSDPTLESVRKVEERLGTLLTRMAGKCFFKTDITGSPANTPDAVDYARRLSEAIYKDVDDVFNRYTDYARHERAVGSTALSLINFTEIHADLQNLLYKDARGKWRDASQLLPRLNKDNDKTLIDEFLEKKPTHNIRVMVYALFAYLKEVAPAGAIASDPTQKANFTDWMRAIRNIYTGANKNARLDNFNDVKSAIFAIDKWLKEYCKNTRTNNTQDILHLFKDYINKNPFSQEQARLDEEAIKASLRINGTPDTAPALWEKSIMQAEDNYYLWGQIIAPLTWAFDGSTHSKPLFDLYSARLAQIFSGTSNEGTAIDFLLIQTLLCYADYRHNLDKDLGSLGTLNNNRDYSWKQYLRKKDPTTGRCGELFKQLIDTWQLPANHTLSFEDFLRKDLAARKGKFTPNDWQYCIVNISDPMQLKEVFRYIGSTSRYVYTMPGGHAYFFRSSTFGTQNRYELLTTFLAYEESMLMPGIKADNPTHANDTTGAHTDFTLPGGDSIRLLAEEERSYTISCKKEGGDLWTEHTRCADPAAAIHELAALGVIASA